MSVQTGAVDNVLFVRWKEPQVSDVSRIVREATQTRADCGRPIVLIAIAPSDMPAPNQDVRNAMQVQFKAILELCAANILVIEGDGLKHSLIRSVATAMFLLSQDRGKTFPVSSVHQALTRAKSHLKNSVDSVEDAARQRGLLSN